MLRTGIRFYSRSWRALLPSSLYVQLNSKYNFVTQVPVSVACQNYHTSNSSIRQFSSPIEDESRNREDKKMDKNAEQKSENDNDGDNKWNPWVVGLLASGVVFGILFFRSIDEIILYNWEMLKQDIALGKVKEILLSDTSNTAFIYLNDQTIAKKMGIPSPARFTNKVEGFQRDLGMDITDFVPVVHSEQAFISQLFLSLLPTIILVLILLKTGNPGMSKGGMDGLMNIASSKHKVATKSNLNIRFTDVAGLGEAKAEVEEFVSFLRTPEKYKKLGAKIPKGALLAGPPGTGKTLLAKAIAGEAQVPFFSISGSDFAEMFVGVGPARVRDLFKQARQNAPCIIWIDEVDAIGRKRSSSGYGNDERENTLNQLLVEMDGFETSTNVIVLAGTNRADVLDSALLRPGRFDRQIAVDAPDIIGRNEIFQVHLKKLLLEPNHENFSKRLAAMTPSMTGAEIANICNEAALIAARTDKPHVEFSDFEYAIERVLVGLERKSRVLSKPEKIRVAYHEAGHAIAGWFLKYASPLVKVSIVPRGVGTLGYAQYLPKDQHLYSTEQLDHELCTLLAGRASEEIKFNNISTGAVDDLEKVTEIIYSQLIKYGMNSIVGNVSMPDESGHMQKFYSESTAKKIDHEAQRMVNDAYERTLQLLREKMDLIEVVAQHLMKHEILKREQMIDLVGPRPFKEISSYDEIIEDSGNSEKKE